MIYHRCFRTLGLSAALLAVTMTAQPALSAKKTPELNTIANYADLADLALNAPVVVVGTITRTIRLKAEDSPGIPPNHARFYVEAGVERLISGRGPLPAAINYVVDMPLDSRGRAMKFEGARALLFLRPVPGRNDQYVLSGRDAQVGWTPEADAKVKAILTEAQGPAGQLDITGIGNAFHVAGTIPGESETQIFLTTKDGRPVSLSILRRPGEVPRWGVSLGDVVDESAQPAGHDTLLWYRLACFLPRQMPASSLQRSQPADQQAITQDYAFVLSQLGECSRPHQPG